MTYQVKFWICVAIGAIGVYLTASWISIPHIIIGFLMVAVVVPFGHYYWAKMNEPKNPMQDEIDALLKKHDQHKQE